MANASTKRAGARRKWTPAAEPADRQVTCPLCDGTKVDRGHRCDSCRGTGSIREGHRPALFFAQETRKLRDLARVIAAQWTARLGEEAATEAANNTVQISGVNPAGVEQAARETLEHRRATRGLAISNFEISDLALRARCVAEGSLPGAAS
jgi:hypothetical protein